MTVDVDCGARAEPRTNLFVMATISAATASGPVKVRNLSPSGALVEGAALPAEKQHVRLRRGRLVVSGEVVWCRAGRAGLRFDSHVVVADWLPQCAHRSAQQRVDEIVQQVKADTAGRSTFAVSEPGQSGAITAADLMGLSEALEALAADLADDHVVIKRHVSKLQTLDIAAQTLRKLAAAR